MQVANTLNNTIRILFNPRLEPFKLFDFLIVKSDEEKYVAQITQIYDDKFDASQNVAKLRLFYKITQDNEVMPYDNFTPNKECEIIKIKQEDIDAFVNQGKKTFVIGTNVKSQNALRLQYDFFNNQPVVLADRIEHANTIMLNLTKNLSNEKPLIIIDSSGNLEYEDSKKLVATKTLKLPLNYSTIDYVFESCLHDGSLEFETVGVEILNEIKKFAKNQESGFIPFNTFVRVVMEQYKVTPYPELKLLVARLKKLQMEEIFARCKKDNDILLNSISKNKVTLIDLSCLDALWQKAYIDYITSEIEDEIYLISRINEENFDLDLMNKIYCKRKNIKFIPNVSYNYKKLPSLMHYCKNYLLMPSLYQRMDFLDANFALSNLILDGCIIFGQNTDNFIYMAQDLELVEQQKRGNYRKINLTIEKDEKSQTQDTKNQTITANEAIITPNNDSSKEFFEELENPNQKKHVKILEEQASIAPSLVQKDDEINYYDKSDNLEGVELQELIDDANKTQQNEVQNGIQNEVQNGIQNEVQNGIQNGIQDKKGVELNSLNQVSQQNKNEDKNESQSALKEENKTHIDKIEQTINEALVDTKDIETQKNNTALTNNIIKHDEAQISDEHQTSNSSNDDESFTFSDEVLDFYEMTQIDDSHDDKDISLENLDNNQDNDIDLSEIADNSIDATFEKIVNAKNEPKAQDTFIIDGETKINSDHLLNKLDQLDKPIENNSEKDTLPIFKEETPKTQTQIYEIGNMIIHKKYGRGTIIKTIKYEDRQLLQIEFEEAGKKLLDPKVADIKLEN